MTILIVIIALSLLIFVHELGHFAVAKFFGIRVDEFGLGFPPRLFGKKVGETTYSINALPFGGFVRIYGEDPGEVKEEPEKSFSNQKLWKKAAVILAGVFMNVLLGWVFISTVFMTGTPEHLAIVEVAPDSPAAMQGIEAGDIILEAKSGEIVLSDPIKGEEFINLVKTNPEGTYLLTLRRGKDILNVSLQGRSDPPEGEGSLGVGLVDLGFPQKSFFGAIISGAETTVNALYVITTAFVNIIVRIFTASGAVETLTGPVGIFFLASEAGNLGILYLVQLTALISLNLAVLNLMPFPALDGGRFLMIVLEKIKGSPIPKRFQIAVNTFGFVLLIILMVVVTIKDIGRFIL